MLTRAPVALREQTLLRGVLGTTALITLAGCLALAGPERTLVIAGAVTGVVAVGWLLRHPLVAAGIAVTTILVLENDTEGFLPATNSFFNRLAHIRLSPADGLLIVALASVIVTRARQHRSLVAPTPFTVPLIMLAVAMIWGFIVGRAAGGSGADTLNALLNLGTLLIVPLVVVNVVEDRATLRAAVLFTASLGTLKALEGLAGWLLGSGRVVDGTHITYYRPAANFVMLVLILGVTALFLMEGRVSLWAVAGASTASVALLLSFRRSFWIATVVGLVVVFAATSRRRKRPLLLLAVAVAGASLLIGVRAGGGTESAALGSRFRSLSASQLSSNAEDAYRIDEEKNVLAEIRHHPVAGIGLGTTWTPRYPLTESYAGATGYTHVTLFWWWLFLGLPGVLALLALWATGIVTGVTVGRADIDPWVRAGSVATAAAIVGMVAAETTGSFTGVDQRYSVMLGALLGLLAVASRLRREATVMEGDI